MIAYVDSSVVLRIVLEQPQPLRELGRYELVTSELTRIECLRAVDNALVRREIDEDEALLRRGAVFQKVKNAHRVALSRSIMERAAGGFATQLGTLDALHVATALLWRDGRTADLVFATHDRQQARAARALGFEVLGA
ncbi:MAG TPA: type II toxin-antitoxin system VapC family toxin [Thermoleophilia bacterium]|nr:type II toxin-antitoxin system VapC family toxin [Thermoleophilia bacterium]